MVCLDRYQLELLRHQELTACSVRVSVCVFTASVSQGSRDHREAKVEIEETAPNLSDGSEVCFNFSMETFDSLQLWITSVFLSTV